MKRKKLLYVGNALSHSGITVTTIDTLSTLLRSEGYEVTVTSSKKNKVLRFLQMLWTLYIRRNRVDGVLIDTYSTTNYWYAVWIGKLCRLYKLPYFPVLHGGNLPARINKSKASAQRLFGNAAMNVAPSGYLYSAFAKAGFSNILHIPNVVQLEKYPFKERRTIAPQILWVRSFAQIYNPLLAIKVLEALLVDYPEATLCMVGPAKDESFKTCEWYVQEHKLPVTFTGKLSKPEWIALSEDYDVFLNTTNVDNTPVSIIEAMALGFPIVSTNVGGLPDLIEDQKTGLLVPKEDLDGTVTAIKALLNDTVLTSQLSLQAREAAQRFDWSHVKIAWNELFSSKI